MKPNALFYMLSVAGIGFGGLSGDLLVIGLNTLNGALWLFFLITEGKR